MDTAAAMVAVADTVAEVAADTADRRTNWRRLAVRMIHGAPRAAHSSNSAAYARIIAANEKCSATRR